jgi:hypothetical protein
MTDLGQISEAVQMTFFDNGRKIKREALEFTNEKIRMKYWYDAIQRAVILKTTVK